MLDHLTKADFNASLNSVFCCQTEPAQTLDLRLVELREGRSSPRQEQFALLFWGPLTAPLGQGLFPMEHPDLGAFDLFLVPIAKDAGGIYYEAVFNRLLPANL